MDMVDIAKSIYECSKRLSKSGDELFKIAREFAETEETYRKALGIEILKLRDERLPVTLISDVARSNVSNLKFERDLAEFKYKAGVNKVQALESEISALQTLYKRQTDV